MASPPILVSGHMIPLYEDDARQYYKSVELMIPLPNANCSDGNNGGGDNTKRESDDDGSNTSGGWTVKVGDLACLQQIIIEEPPSHSNTTNSNDDDSTNKKHTTTPFILLATSTTEHYYKPIQILSIYQERLKNKLSTSKRRRKKKRYNAMVFMEVRYFYRGNDLDERNQRYYCGGERGQQQQQQYSSIGNGVDGGGVEEEEVFESDHVEVVNASSLLGRLVLNNSSSNNAPPHCSNNKSCCLTAAAADTDIDESAHSSVPTITMNYNHRLFYLHQEKDVLQFNPSSLGDDDDDDAKNNDALLLRGIKSSNIMSNNDKVKMATCNYLNLDIMSNDNDEDEEGMTVEQVAVTLPPPTLTLLQQLKDDGTVSRSPSKKKQRSSSSSPNKKQQRSSPNKQMPKHPLSNKEDDDNSIPTTTTTTTTIHYYPSCQMQFPISPTTHPYESLPIHWNVCVGDVVAVHCSDGTSPMGVDKREQQQQGGDDGNGNNEWYPYRVPWAHAQITAIYRTVDKGHGNEDEDGSCKDGTTSTTITTVSAGEVKYDLRWFPRISESLKECQDRPVLSKRLSEIAWDKSRTCEEILEGNHEDVGFLFLTLLGPIWIGHDNNGGKQKSDAVSSNTTQFATQNRRTINSTMYCDKLNQPKQSTPQKRGNITPSGSNTNDGLVDRGIEASRLWLSGNSQRKVYRKAVIQSRKERDGGVVVSMEDAHVSESASIQKKSPGSSQQQLLFSQSPAAAAAAPTATPKERRSKRGETPVSKAEPEPKSKKRKQATSSQKELTSVTTGGDDDDDDNVPLSALVYSEEGPGWSQTQTSFDQSPAATAPTAATKERRSKRGKTPVPKAKPEPQPKKRKQPTPSQKELISTQKEETLDDVVTLSRVKCTKQPFHVDVSSQKSFYDEIDIHPPIDSYGDRFSTKQNDNTQLWKVRLGDMVCIEVEHKQKADLVTFPFVVTWSPAEIVSIYRVHSTKAECLELREKLQCGDQFLNAVGDNASDVMVEVRWFYRKHEIPGAGNKSSKSQSNDDDELEEIFETDQVDSCHTECLLSPVKLYEVSRPDESLPSVVSGMPIIYYHCRRYWSIHRKSFVPSGLLSNRIERGRMHSQYKAALSKLPSTSASNGRESSGHWKEGFQNAIQKLSLAEAAADVQVHGMELRCRERERQHIGSFLRKAIRGLEQRTDITQDDDDSVMRDDEGTMNTKSSIFICGPPGTGKVSSLCFVLFLLDFDRAKL